MLITAVAGGILLDGVGCPICKNPMQQDGEFNLPKVRSKVLPGFRTEPAFSQGLTVIALTCQTCGHVALFNHGILQSLKR